MEIVQVSKNFIKIKGKSAGVLLLPPLLQSDKLTKTTEADVVLMLDYPYTTSTVELKPHSSIPDISKAEGVKLTIQGPGEYEIGGIKISGYKVGSHIVYTVFVDNIEILVGQTDGIESFDKKKECHVVLLCANSDLNPAFVTTVSPKYVVLYGDKADEVYKKIATSQDTSSKILPKVTTTLDKLPAEMDVVILS